MKIEVPYVKYSLVKRLWKTSLTSWKKLTKSFFLEYLIQLNEYETDPCFLQNFQSNTTICLIIHVFCKSCEPDIVLAVLQIKTKTISRSQTLQKVWIIKQTVVLLWRFLRKYGSVSYLFSCNCFWKNFLLELTYWVTSNLRGRFFQILWPYHNILNFKGCTYIQKN